MPDHNSPVKATDAQKQGYDEWHAASNLSRWEFHDTTDPLIRYLRDRRLIKALRETLEISGMNPAESTALVICGGVGGEGTFLANHGFKSVIVSDISSEALRICEKRDARLQTRQIDAENIELPDASYDLVLVQEGLHHMPRPPLALTEALRVAKRAVIVLEPHSGIVAKVMGTKWEIHGPAENYVFRWNREYFSQCVHSYLLRSNYAIRFIRRWEHSGMLGRVGRLFGGGAMGLAAVKIAYLALDMVFGWLGNSMIGIVVKCPVPPYNRPIGGKIARFEMVNPD